MNTSEVISVLHTTESKDIAANYASRFTNAVLSGLKAGQGDFGFPELTIEQMNLIAISLEAPIERWIAENEKVAQQLVELAQFKNTGN